MRFFASVKLPIFGRLAPRVGVISDAVHPFRKRKATAEGSAAKAASNTVALFVIGLALGALVLLVLIAVAVR